LGVVACGGTTTAVVAPAAAPALPIPTAVVVLSTPQPTTAAPPSTPAPPTPPPTRAPDEFAIVPVRSPGAGGSVTVTAAGVGAVHYHVVVTGLAPGSTHTIHDHRGNCAAAAASAHLSTLATTAADAGGVIALDETVSATLAGPGRIVIVYAGASQAVIIGCAQL
jgi:hypothetical protein